MTVLEKNLSLYVKERRFDVYYYFNNFHCTQFRIIIYIPILGSTENTYVIPEMYYFIII